MFTEGYYSIELSLFQSRSVREGEISRSLMGFWIISISFSLSISISLFYLSLAMDGNWTSGHHQCRQLPLASSRLNDTRKSTVPFQLHEAHDMILMLKGGWLIGWLVGCVICKDS